jgi:hypothetical protein
VAKLSDRIDHFVRWFFTSSPDATVEPPTRGPATAKKPKGAERRRATSKRRGAERRAAAPGRGRGAST